MKTWPVKLTYFKPSGKYYDAGEYNTTLEHVFRVFEEVKELQQRGKLPGLMDGCGQSFYIHINLEAHPNGYPGLVMPLKT